MADCPGGSAVRNPPANAGDMGSIPGLGRYPEEGKGNSLQYSCLGNPTHRGAWWATVHGVAKESDTAQQLNNNREGSKEEEKFLFHPSLVQVPLSKLYLTLSRKHTCRICLFTMNTLYHACYICGLCNTRMMPPLNRCVVWELWRTEVQSLVFVLENTDHLPYQDVPGSAFPTCIWEQCCSSFRGQHYQGAKEKMGFPSITVVKNPPASAGDARDVGSISGSGRSPEGGNGNPLQRSCLENSMDRGCWWAIVPPGCKQLDMTEHIPL